MNICMRWVHLLSPDSREISRKIRENYSQIGRSYSAKLWHFCQFRSKEAIIHTIAIKWKECSGSIDCHHSWRLCGDRMKMSLPKKILP